MIGTLKALFETPARETEEALRHRLQLASAALLIETARADFTQDGEEKKLQLIHNMWVVAWADGNIDKYEEHLIRRVAELIYVSHQEFIRSKLAARP